MDDVTEHDHGNAGVGSTDQLFDALADERRRAVLDALSAAEQPVDVHRLAERVAARERRGDDAGRPPRDAVRRALVSLHHAHLPKLADAGLVEYDADARVVRTVGELPDLPGL